MKKFLQKILNGHTVIKEAFSSINRNVFVVEDLLGSRSLVVGGLVQSGTKMEKIWGKVLKDIKDKNNEIQNCLILGLGTGSAARLINQLYPETQMVGVEIDSEVVKLGEKYFGLDKINNLKIEICDAFKFINHSCEAGFRSARHFDLILVDLYLGSNIPIQAEKDQFLQSIKKLLSPKGYAIFNRLYSPKEERQKTDIFEKMLEKVLCNISTTTASLNKLFLCKNK